MILNSYVSEKFYALLLQNTPLSNFVQITLVNKEQDSEGTIQVFIEDDAQLLTFAPITVPPIAANTSWPIALKDFQIHWHQWHLLTENIQSNITIKVVQNDVVLVSKNHPITIYPIDSFPGFKYNKYLSGLITPNSQTTYLLKQKIIPILQKLKYAIALDGYQQQSKQRVIEMVTALFYALREEKWVYSSLPASYEAEGQRIRLIDQVNEMKFGNCIDISLIIAGVLESLDLHPLIILIPNHAFVGCWLVPETMEQVVTEHKNELTQRTAKGIQDIVLFEATSVCLGQNSSFKDAVDQAEKFILGSQHFQAAIDVKLSRILGVKPININKQEPKNNADWNIKESKAKIESVSIQEEAAPLDWNKLNPQAIDKQLIWERKLLDLTLRNSLLNLKLSNNTIQLVNINFNDLLLQLINNKQLTISNTKAINLFLNRREMLDVLHDTAQLFQFAAHEFSQNRLLSLYDDEDLNTVLSHIHRNNQSAIDESGAASLFLSLGVLNWKDQKPNTTTKLAPLVLIPVELKRSSLISKFSIKLRENEIQINTTLLQFLLQEYSLNLTGLNNYIEEQEEYIDLQVIFNTIRKAISHHKDWEIDELLFLSNFNFKTQAIWNDIHEHMDTMKNHPVINSLINLQPFRWVDETPTNEIANDIYDVQKHISPITADSSQLDAIISANNGNSFVLHGPPGTGKSQTITNIIANFLYHNKTVLFVASKKAALDVVHNRLVNIGLENYVLELHSNKAKKTEVLLQLERTLAQSKLKPDGQFIESAVAYTNERKQIVQTLEAVHQKQSCGTSIYELINSIIESPITENTLSSLDFSVAQLQGLHSQLLQQWLQFVKELEYEPILQTNLVQHPLQSISKIDYYLGIEQAWNSSEIEKINHLNNSLNNIIKLTYNQNNISISNIPKIGLFLTLLSEHKDIPIKLLHSNFFHKKDDYFAVIELHQKLETSKRELSKNFHLSVLTTDTAFLKNTWSQAQSKWFLPKYFAERKVIKTLKNHALHEDFNKHTILETINKIEYINSLEFNLNNEHNKILISELGKIELNEKSGEVLLNYVPILQKATALLKELQLSAYIEQLITERHATSSFNALLTPLSAWDETATIWENNKEKINLFQQSFTSTQSIETLDDLLNAAQIVSNNSSLLSGWKQYLDLKEKAKTLDLNNLIELIENKQINTDKLYLNFQYKINKSLVQYYVSHNTQLRTFHGSKMEQMLATFNKYQLQYKEQCKRETFLIKNRSLPNIQYSIIDNSELTILQRAIKSKGRGWSIRNLFLKTANTLPKVAPCMLMSPISVAQYLSIDLPKFDLVLFDEASQLPTSEAVSAIARGQQIIIVGDPKQMPPTAFFSSQSTEDEYSELDDLESILDDTLSINLPSKYLLRHYRSQHESLIAFSNATFYDNALFTFPSADDLQSKVSWVHVPGHYDKGKTRQNIFEATAIVNEVRNLLHAPNGTQKTIGIVTFSQTQQALIIQLMDEMFLKFPEMEQKSWELDEPIFIKNLENVQGDERDIILFSIGYAADKTGNLSMNFGPLNREGGWRRLNVAVTRAKHQMKVFSTLRPEDIDSTKTQAQGPLALKAFLRFAQSQTFIQNRTKDIHQDAIAKTIVQELERANYEVVCNIGQSHFKVDIGVVHPNKPQQFVLGILLDSPEFNKIGNIQDRYHIIPMVLQQLKWNILPIWTLDWEYRKDEVIQKILEKINDCIVHEVAQPIHDGIIIEPITPFHPDALTDLIIEDEASLEQYRMTYEYAHLTVSTDTGADALMSSTNREIVKNQMLKIVTAEAPINCSTMIKRLQSVWGISRSGARIERFIKEMIQELALTTSNFQDDVFVWPFQYDVDAWKHYRILTPQDKRAVTEVAPQEWCICLKAVLEHHTILSKEAAYKYLQKTLLNSRYNINNNDFIEKALILDAANKGIIITDNDYQLEK